MIEEAGEQLISSHYILENNAEESRKLTEQHTFMTKHAFDNRLIYDPLVKLTNNDRVLDAGTGNGIWSISLSRQVREKISIDAIDTSTDMFPKAHPANISFHKESVTCLPKDWSGRFTFVHQRFLMGGILATEWPQALSEHQRVLKSGGHIQLLESSFADWDNTSVERNFFEVFQEVFNSGGMVFDCGVQLPRKLLRAGFVDIHMDIRLVPVGKQAGEESNTYASHLIEAIHGITVRSGVLRTFGLSDDDYCKICYQMKAEWDAEEGGRKFPVIVVHARKP